MRLIAPYQDYVIAQKFGANGNASYQRDGMLGHPANDLVSQVFIQTGKGAAVTASMSGPVYKITNKDNPDLTKFRGVFQLSDDGTLEICYGHLSEIWVEEGEYLAQGQPIGREGNTGEVYVNGLRVTDDQRKKGMGTHCHWQGRDVVKTQNPVFDGKNQFLDCVAPLGNRQEIIYQDHQGNYYFVPNYQNGFHGCRDLLPDLYKPTPFQWVDIWTKVFSVIANAFKGRNSNST